MIVVAGVDKLLATLAEKAVLSDVAVAAGLDEIGAQVLGVARADVPWLTGTLYRSLKYERIDVTTARVFTDVVYASEVEYGGLHNPVEPYMRPAADTVDTEAAAAVMRAIIDV